MNAAALNQDALKLSPVIFSHGMLADSTSYSRHNLELASHGYIVFVPNHHDGSCAYTEKSDGSPIKFDRSVSLSNFAPVWKKNVDIREQEVHDLIKEI